MKLSQLFSGDTHAENVTRPQQTPAQAAGMNRQLRSLVPGQTISGEVLAKNGGEVQIKLSEDMVLNARVDRNLNIEVGKTLTFEVKNNGISLTLSPLFTNVSTDMNILKALEMAGLPVNRVSVDMTQQLMQAGLPVNRTMLQQIYREISSFPENEISDVINLHKLQMPVTENNMEQMAAYRNLNHQLVEGMDVILEGLPQVFGEMVAEGDIAGAVRLYQEILNLIAGNGNGDTLPEQAVPEGEDVQKLPEETNVLQTEEGEAAEGNRPVGNQERLVIREQEGNRVLVQGQEIAGNRPAEREQAADRAPAASGSDLTGRILELLDSLQNEVQAQGLKSGQGQAETQNLLTTLNTMIDLVKSSGGDLRLLEKLFSGKEFQQFLSGQLREAWLLRPEEVAVPGKVEEMYRRLDRQLKGLSQALEHAGQTNSAAFRASSAMSGNVDFLQQLNQMYTYVQLPLRLQQGDTHGELYVYANKKKMTEKDGAFSALLHLDMEHLGPLDVYVTLQTGKVNTKFYLPDEEMIDFIAGHMSILTERLKNRGYECSFSMNLRETGKEDAAGGGLAPLLGQEKRVMLSQYAFDVRT